MILSKINIDKELIWELKLWDMRLGLVLRLARKRKRLTAKELGEKAGLSAAHIIYIEKGQRTPTLQKLTSISEALDISLVDIFKQIEDPGEENPTHDKLPLYSLTDVSYFDPSNFYGTKSTLPPRIEARSGEVDLSINGQYMFAMKIQDDSMRPEFFGGDVVIVDPSVYSNTQRGGLNPQIKNGDYVIAKLAKERRSFTIADSKKPDITFRQIIFHRDNKHITLHPLNNDDYNDIILNVRRDHYDEINLDILSVIGKVVRKIRYYE